MSQHKIFAQSSFAGAAGTDLANVVATHTDGTAPSYTAASGSAALDGNGNLVTQSGTTVKVGNVPIAGIAAFDFNVASTPPGGGFAIAQFTGETGSTAYVYRIRTNISPAVLDVIRNASDGTNSTLGQATPPAITGPYTMGVQRRPQSDGSLNLSVLVNGSVVLTVNDPTPLSPEGPAGGNLGWIDFTGGSTWQSAYVLDLAASALTLTLGSSSGPAGVESGAFTVGANQPAGDGGIAVALQSTGSGDVFHDGQGNTITTLTIPDGASSATTKLLPGSAGARTITTSSPGLTAPAGQTYTASAPPTTNPTVTGVTVSPANATLMAGAAQQYIATVSGTNSPGQGVTWQAQHGTITSAGLYTAPAAGGADQADTITATSIVDPSKSGAAVVMIPALGSAVWTTILQFDNAVSSLPGFAVYGAGASPVLNWSNANVVALVPGLVFRGTFQEPPGPDYTVVWSLTANTGPYALDKPTLPPGGVTLAPNAFAAFDALPNPLPTGPATTFIGRMFQTWARAFYPSDLTINNGSGTLTTMGPNNAVLTTQPVTSSQTVTNGTVTALHQTQGLAVAPSQGAGS